MTLLIESTIDSHKALLTKDSHSNDFFHYSIVILTVKQHLARYDKSQETKPI